MSLAEADFDPGLFAPGSDEVSEQPMVIAWEALDRDEFANQLHGLRRWVDWLVELYRPASLIVAPCWFAHPIMVEELGHLWTGWQTTRHPLSGVGMAGLDWDIRREQAFARLRESVAVSGCAGRKHVAPDPRQAFTSAAAVDDYLAVQTGRKHNDAELRARFAAARSVLAAAELRHNHAGTVLNQVARDPGSATQQEQDETARLLRALADTAVSTAIDAARQTGDGPSAVEPEHHLAHGRDRLAIAIVRGDTEAIAEAARAWTAALNDLVPADEAAARAAAAARLRRSAGPSRSSESRPRPEGRPQPPA